MAWPIGRTRVRFHFIVGTFPLFRRSPSLTVIAEHAEDVGVEDGNGLVARFEHTYFDGNKLNCVGTVCSDGMKSWSTCDRKFNSG